MNNNINFNIMRFMMAFMSLMAFISSNAAEMRIRNLDRSSGLSSGCIFSIAEDEKGYIWIATMQGLDRYDGIKFSHYDKYNSGLSANELNSVCMTPGDTDKLWIATQRDGLCVMDLPSGEIRRFEQSKLLSPDIREVFPGKEGGLWAVHYHMGLQYIDTNTEECKEITSQTIAGLPRKTWTAREDDAGHIYIGHVEGGMSIVNCIDNSCRVITDLPGLTVYSLCIDKRGNVWIGCDQGAACYSPDRNSVTKFVHSSDDAGSISPGRVFDIQEMADGSIWFATSEGGISIVNPTYNSRGMDTPVRFSHIPYNQGNIGTSSSYIRDIFQDSHGNVWLGNYRTGLDVMSHVPIPFSRLSYTMHGPTHLSYKPSWSGAVNPVDGSIWFGGENEIICYRNGMVTEYKFPIGQLHSHAYVRSMHVDGYGRIWCGTSERGVMIYDPSRNNWHVIDGLPGDVRVVYGKDDSVLIGTASGLYVVNESLHPQEYEKINTQLKDRIVQALWMDKEGRLWVGTHGKGVSIFDNEGNRIGLLDVESGFPSNGVNAIKGDSSGRIWIATREGVVRTDKNGDWAKYELFSHEHGIQGHVMSIEEDYRHNFWIGTDAGLVHYIDHTGKAYSYTGMKDMPLDSFFEGGSVRDSIGNLYFVGNNGIVKFNPREAENRVEASPARVTDFVVYTSSGRDQSRNEKLIPLDGKMVKLPYDTNTFKIYFNVLDFGESTVTDFTYNLKGLDDIWTEDTGEHSVLYRNLPPGTYKFQIRQRAKGHDWGEPYELLTIEITPPFWATWWAKVLYVAIVLGLVLSVGIFYKRRISYRQKLLLEQEQSRQKERLNEERLKFYTNITHELRTPLTLISGPLDDIIDDPELPKKYSSKIQLIRDSSQRLLSLVNDILEFRKTETQNRSLSVAKGNLSNLLREIGIRYRELNRNPDVSIQLDIESNDHNIYYDQDMITTIVENLMSNAVKYTPKGEITLSLHTLEENGIRYSEIKVSDTGYGISKDGLPHIFERYYQTKGNHQASGTGIGLALVKNLTELHQATITVESEENKGSVFTVRLLTDNVYANEVHRIGTDVNHSPIPDVGSMDSDGKVKILIVEDNSDIKEYISGSLKDDYEVMTASNGWEGLRCVSEFNPDMVISDIMMPELDGLQMCRKLKEDILTSHIPVVLLTAKDTLVDKEAGYEVGADSYLTKPFSVKLLKSRIRNLLQARRRLARLLMQKPSAVKEEKEETMKEEQQAMDRLTPLDRQFIEKINELINTNLANEELGVQFLTDKMCVSAPTLYRKMTALLGVSANEYIRHLRLLKAVELLETGEYTVSDIAIMTGFGNHSAFGKVFKKEYGCTATEYIKNKKFK